MIEVERRSHMFSKIHKILKSFKKSIFCIFDSEKGTKRPISPRFIMLNSYVYNDICLYIYTLNV